MERTPDPQSQTPPQSDFPGETQSGPQPNTQAETQPESQAKRIGVDRTGVEPQWHGPGSGPPPWWGPPRRHWRWDQRHAQRRPTWLFFRFAGVFGLIALTILGGLALLIFFVVKLAGGDRHTAAQIWLGTCGLLLVVPFIVVRLGRRAFRNIAAPLSNLMQASDRVAAGDLSVRVPVAERGEFAELSNSFNHMVEELARPTAAGATSRPTSPTNCARRFKSSRATWKGLSTASISPRLSTWKRRWRKLGCWRAWSRTCACCRRPRQGSCRCSGNRSMPAIC